MFTNILHEFFMETSMKIVFARPLISPISGLNNPLKILNSHIKEERLSNTATVIISLSMLKNPLVYQIAQSKTHVKLITPNKGKLLYL